MRKTLIAIASLCSFSGVSFAQSSNTQVVNLVCSNDAFAAGPPQSSSFRVRSTCASSYSTKIVFYLVKIRSGSTFTFEVQSDDRGDYDFLSWKNPPLADINNITLADINSLPSADRGNRNTGGDSQDGKIGLKLNAPTTCRDVGTNNDGFERHYDVQAGDIILIGIDRWGSNSGFSISFGGDAVLDCSITIPGQHYYKCDEGDGTAQFDLTPIATELLNNNPRLIYKIYTTEEDAFDNTNNNIAQNPFTAHKDTNPNPLFFRVEDFITGLADIHRLNFNVIDPPQYEDVVSSFCDTPLEGDNAEPVSLVTVFNNIVGGSDDYTATYYATREDADAETNAIANPSQFVATHNGKAFIRINNEYNCSTVVEVSFTNASSPLNNAVIEVCDKISDGLGVETVDLTPAGYQIIGNLQNVTIKYYPTRQDADNGTNEITNTTAYLATFGSNIYAKVFNAGGCSTIAQIEVRVQPVNFEAEPVITFCDTADAGTGAETVDLTSIEAGLLQTVENATFIYYSTLADAEANVNAIANPSAYVHTLGSTAYVRVVDPEGCSSIQSINFTLKELEVSLGEPFAICEGNVPLRATTNLQGETFTYKWFFNGNEVTGATSETYNVTVPGTYSVEVTSNTGCMGTSEIVIAEGEGATISEINVNENTVSVIATSDAMPLQYSMDGLTWQDSNVFTNIAGGEHTVFVKNADGCISSRLFSIFSIPTMFTPNGDGYNDVWKINGIELYQGSSLEIYDRSGRLLIEKRIDSNVIWDGFFADGKKAPSTDYWYIIKLTDGRKFSGSVTVKSRGAKENNS